MGDLLRVRNLHVSITLPRSEVEAVRGVDFRIRPGSTVALVGESGSGKSITALSLMGMDALVPTIGRDLTRGAAAPGRAART